jgi:hypothetical protein
MPSGKTIIEEIEYLRWHNSVLLNILFFTILPIKTKLTEKIEIPKYILPPQGFVRVFYTFYEVI